MCIISGQVTHVSKTRIFVAPLLEHSTQLTIYANTVDMHNHGTMILPVPRGDVQFIDLSSYSDIFDDLAHCFPDMRLINTNSSGVTRSFNDSISDPVEVGSYKASTAPTPSSLVQLLTFPLNQTYHVSPDVVKYLQQYYDDSYSFVICVLKRGSVKYHPFAYSHSCKRNGDLFIPTRHYHESHNISESHPDWDHTIYCWNCTTDIPFPRQCNKQFTVQHIIDQMKYKSLINLPDFKNLKQYKITSNFHKNCDFVARA